MNFSIENRFMISFSFVDEKKNTKEHSLFPSFFEFSFLILILKCLHREEKPKKKDWNVSVEVIYFPVQKKGSASGEKEYKKDRRIKNQ